MAEIWNDYLNKHETNDMLTSKSEYFKLSVKLNFVEEYYEICTIKNCYSFKRKSKLVRNEYKIPDYSKKISKQKQDK